MLIRYKIQLGQTTSSLPATNRCQDKGEDLTCSGNLAFVTWMDAYFNDSHLKTSVSWGIPTIHQSKNGGRSCENRSPTMFEGYYVLHTGDTKEADSPIDNTMCEDILINVIFGCEFGCFDLE